MVSKVLRPALVVVVLAVLAVLYFVFDPAGTNIFPSCPLKTYTGILCPGCGSQRAIHSLLHLDIATALGYNPMLVVAIPYILLGVCLDLIPYSNPKIIRLRKFLYGQKAIWVVFTAIVLFWIIRNIF